MFNTRSTFTFQGTCECVTKSYCELTFYIAKEKISVLTTGESYVNVWFFLYSNRIQNYNAHVQVCFGLEMYDHISSELKILKWLPIDELCNTHMFTFRHPLSPSHFCYSLAVTSRDLEQLSITRFGTSLFRRSFS